ncbi:MAG: leucyl aminopeptidase, partial [Chloroflexi bacterium]|nr:leucyl aminopeptidase [Chloroflexota bacterium]
MEVKVVTGDITEIDADAIVVNLFQGVEEVSGASAAVDKALGGAISSLISKGEFKGKFGEVSVVHTLG